MTPTEQLIAAKYGGPLLRLEEVAEILGRRPNAIRTLINQGNGDPVLAQRLRECQVRLGRRVMFRMNRLAKMIDEA